MAQYIDKSALVAEIERLIDKGKYYKEYYCAYRDGNNSALYALKEIINTLEVKEVDLEKHLKEDIEEVLFDLNGVAVKGATYYLTVEDVKDIAKHFYELGMLSTITEEDCKLIWNIGDEIPNMPEEDFFGELLRRYKAQKGEEV